MEGVSHLIDALAHFVGVCAWPLIGLVVLFKFYTPIVRALEKVTDLRVKAPDLDISAKIEAAAALGAAAASRDDAAEDKDQIAAKIVDIVDLPIKKRTKIILWVDDRPQNNAYERSALGAIGVRFVLSRSTDDALRASDGNADALNLISGRLVGHAGGGYGRQLFPGFTPARGGFC